MVDVKKERSADGYVKVIGKIYERLMTRMNERVYVEKTNYGSVGVGVHHDQR